ncbi:MAG: zinc-dependent alcohol dehydrogenase family protein [Nevskia sp.]|nr:zinc-dependent alcohol dehydrogenase family protein [Nevskia sp.]
MLAVRYSRYGNPPDVAELYEAPEPGTPGPGEVLVDVDVTAINPSDLLRFEGRYGKEGAALPADAGSGGVGTVAAVGPGVVGVKPGDPALLHTYFIGTGLWRQRLKARAEDIFPLPPADPLQLGMLTGNPPSAWVMLHDYVKLQPGEWLIQNAANSAVGHYLIKLARGAGLRTLNVVRRADAVQELVDFGGDAVLVDGPDLAERVRQLTGGKPPRLAIDAIAGEATQRLANSVADGGTVVNYGLLSGQACRVEPRDTVFRDVTLRGFWLQSWWNHTPRQDVRALYARLAGMVADGSLTVPVEATYPLSKIRQALEHAARPGRVGKVLLRPQAG